ncbi:hypothetical protein BGZ58_003070 [Dissophora ornata]|nr:hypothetical protein BGZ58_003070 [Dissophora ornata]
MEFVIAIDDPMTNRQIGYCKGGTKITGIGQDMGSASIRQSTHLSGVPNFRSKTTGAYDFNIELLATLKSPLNLQPRLWMKSRNSRNITTIESRIGYKAATGTLLNRGDCIKMENVRSEDKPRPQDDTAGVTVVFYISETLFAGVGHRLAIVRSLMD